MRVEPGRRRRNLKTMAQWIERLHADADLLAFPQIDLDAPPPPGGTPKPPSADEVFEQYDVFQLFALKRRTPLAGGFISCFGGARRGVVGLAHPSGQWDSANPSPPGDATDEAPPSCITAMIEDVQVGVASAEDLSKPGLPRLIGESRPSVFIIPLYLTGGQGELRRIAVHNPPAALAGLLEEMRLLATRSLSWVLAVNAISDDAETQCGPCGGAYVIDPRGRIVEQRELYDEEPLSVRISIRK